MQRIIKKKYHFRHPEDLMKFSYFLDIKEFNEVFQDLLFSLYNFY